MQIFLNATTILILWLSLFLYPFGNPPNKIVIQRRILITAKICL